MSEADSSPVAAAGPHRPGVAHIVPLPFLFAVFGALLVLTVVTVAVTFVDLGSMNLVVALGIATVKASLVALYFMHLRWDKPVNALAFITAIVFVMLFVGMVLLDTTEYRPDLIPDHAPAVNK